MAEIGHNGAPDTIEGRSGNWIAISRDIIDHHIVGAGRRVDPADKNEPICFNRMEAWIDLLGMANFAERRVDLRGATLILSPGQTMAGRAFLAKRWNWTEKTVRGFLERLERELMITLACETLKQSTGPGDARAEVGKKTGHQKGHLPNVLTICNWSKYQAVPDQEGPPVGPPKGQPRASQGPHYNKDTTLQDKIPPLPPKGGEGADQDDFAGIDREPPKADRERQDVVAAFDVYGKAAEHFGLVRCQVHTAARTKRLAKRLADIGGVENFRLALRALGNTSDPLVLFLRGKAPPRPGEQPFRLDIDRLMQTDGKLGDVLARLLDTAEAARSAQADTAPVWAGWTADEWDRQIDANANGIWPWAKLGPPPGAKGCACPPDIVTRRRLTEVYDHNGISRGKH